MKKINMRYEKMIQMNRYKDIDNEMLDEEFLLCKYFILRCSKRDTDIDLNLSIVFYLLKIQYPYFHLLKLIIYLLIQLLYFFLEFQN